jgi:Ca2+-binding EF-hand superfamily protein
MKTMGAVLLVAAALFGAGQAGQETPQQAAQREKKLDAGEKEAKRILLLMDKDKSGKVSKQEFMSFMEAEFERMDTNKDGELDVDELTHSRVIVRGRSR